MAEVLVLVDHVDGKVRKTTSELLTIARRLGEPSAVFVGTGFDAAKETLARFGAEKVYRVESPEVLEHLVVPQAELLAQLVASTSPAAVLVPSSPEGKEIAARLAVKTESGLITDAVDVQAAATARRRDHPVGLRRLLHRRRPRSRRARPSSPSSRTRPRPRRSAAAGRRRGRRLHPVRRRQGREDHRVQAEAGHRPPRADRGRHRRLRWPRHRRRLLQGRGLRRLASAPRSAPRVPPSTPGGTPTPRRSARPASR